MGGNNKEKNLIKNTLLFTVGNVGAKLLMLIIVPLYTYYVSTEQMGQYDLVNTYVNLFSPVACLAIFESIYRWLLDLHSDRGRILKTGLLVLLVSMIAFDALALVVTRMLSYEYWLEFNRTGGRFRNLHVCAVYDAGIAQQSHLCDSGYPIYCLPDRVQYHFCGLAPLAGARLAGVNGYCLFDDYCIPAVVAKKRFVPNKREQFKQGYDRSSCSLFTSTGAKYDCLVARFGFKSCDHQLEIGRRSKWDLFHIHEISYVGQYAFNFFYQAWQEQSISEYGSSERDAYYTKIFNIYAGLLLSGIVALLPVTKIVIQYFMDSSYASASHYVSILYLSSAFNAFASFYGTGYLSVKKTAGSFYTTVCGAALNVILTLVLVSKLGLFAAALGNMMGNMAIWIVRIVQTRRYFNIQIRAEKIVALLLVNVVFAILVENVDLPLLIVLEFVTIALFLLFNRHLFVALLKGIRRKQAE